ncbi:LAMI_0E15170g1_1 [Lachancea mirantina]|uniref:LAMI_0E15170g1_1 n=1 Tax=Lachancea mirantina TaxID=1230905 RepID=A0A1G4JSI7_9SACH|nr:LAMI_0E15170g1_1 [Lachancea mirantina]
MTTLITPPRSPMAGDKATSVESKHTRAVVPVNSTADILRATDTLAKAFKNCPANDYLMKKFFNLKIDEHVSKARINSILSYFNALYMDKGGEIVEANDFDAVAVWTAPGKHFHQDETNDAKFNKVFFDDLYEVRKRVLPSGLDCYYLFIIGKDLTKPEVRGSVRAIFDEYKRLADERGVALVLEAISDRAKSVYEYFGFKNYYTFHFGEGEVDSEGHVDPNGKGFVGYLMIYYKDELPGAIEN